MKSYQDYEPTYLQDSRSLRLKTKPTFQVNFELKDISNLWMKEIGQILFSIKERMVQ